MSRRGWAVAGVIAVAAVGLALVLKSFSKPSKPDADLTTADRVTLFSIDGRDEPRWSGTGEELYSYPVLGKVEIADPADRRRLSDALKEGLTADGFTKVKACFWPRHVLRVDRGGRTTDYVICFQCTSYRLYVDGERRPGGGFADHVRPAFSKPLEDAGIPIAPQE